MQLPLEPFEASHYFFTCVFLPFNWKSPCRQHVDWTTKITTKHPGSRFQFVIHLVQRRSDVYDVRLVWDFVWLQQHSLFSTSWPHGAVTFQRSSCAAECANWVKMCWHFTNTSLQKQHETHPVNYWDYDRGMTQTRLHQDTAPDKRWPPKLPVSFGEHLRHLQHLPAALHESSCVRSCSSHLGK